MKQRIRWSRPGRQSRSRGRERQTGWQSKAGSHHERPYIQHIAHDLIEKRGKSESEAIGMAVGIVKRWARGGGNVDANTRAAAALAVKQWEEKKAKAHVSEAAPWEVREAERQITATAIARLAVLKGKVGHDGIGQLLNGRALMEQENDSEAAQLVEQLGEMARWDVLTAANRIPSLGALAQEALAPLPLGEFFNPRELRDLRGRWSGGGHHNLSPGALLTEPGSGGPAGVPLRRPVATRTLPSATARRRTPNESFARYEGGVVRASARSRIAAQSGPRLDVEDEAGLSRAIPEGEHTPGARLAADQIIGGKFGRGSDATQLAHAMRDEGGQVLRSPDGGVIYSPERTQLHARIIEALLSGKTPAHGLSKPKAIFTAGGPASGKSALIRSGIVKVEGREPDGRLGHDNMVHVNPDIVRRMLPEYEMFQHAGLGEEAANLTHEEASDLAKTVHRVAMGRQMHIMVDGVGDSGPGKFAGKIKAARDAGYETSVHYADTGIDHAIARANKRGDDHGRYVSHGTIIENHIGVAARFPEIAAIPGVHVRVFDTSGPQGSTPRLIAEKSPRDDSTAILDSGRMREFQSKANLSVDAELARRGETWQTMRAKR